MHKLDEIRPNSNMTDCNFIPTHLNFSDVCTRPIDLSALKIKMII